MKVNSTVRIKQLNTDILVNPCSQCGHKDELDLDALGLTEEVDAPVTFTLPDKMLMRDQDGKAQGVIDTLEILKDLGTR